jgi:hypothetical protein
MNELTYYAYSESKGIWSLKNKFYNPW